MHDLSLGGPVNVGEVPEAKHSGPCYDGVFGCHLCANAENGGKGQVSNCDTCDRVTFTKVVRASDEPVMYQLCVACRHVQRCGEAYDYRDDDCDDASKLLAAFNQASAERDKLKSTLDGEAQAIFDAQLR